MCFATGKTRWYSKKKRSQTGRWGVFIRDSVLVIGCVVGSRRTNGQFCGANKSEY